MNREKIMLPGLRVFVASNLRIERLPVFPVKILRRWQPEDISSSIASCVWEVKNAQLGSDRSSE